MTRRHSACTSRSTSRCASSSKTVAGMSERAASGSSVLPSTFADPMSSENTYTSTSRPASRSGVRTRASIVGHVVRIERPTTPKMHSTTRGAPRRAEYDGSAAPTSEPARMPTAFAVHDLRQMRRSWLRPSNSRSSTGSAPDSSEAHSRASSAHAAAQSARRRGGHARMARSGQRRSAPGARAARGRSSLSFGRAEANAPADSAAALASHGDAGCSV